MGIVKSEEVVIDGRTYEKDDIVRVDGEYGMRFMFLHHAVNTDNGKEWVTVNEIRKGQVGMFRSFKKERIRPLRSKKKAPKVRSVKGDATAIRAWCKEQGIEVNERGRISKDIRAQYDSRSK